MKNNVEKKSRPRRAHQKQKKYITDQAILARLEKGPATRNELARITGLTDRRLREHIAMLQEKDNGDGRLIINLQDRTGYKIARTPGELEAYARQEKARATKILRKLKNQTWQEDRQIVFE